MDAILLGAGVPNPAWPAGGAEAPQGGRPPLYTPEGQRSQRKKHRATVHQNSKQWERNTRSTSPTNTDLKVKPLKVSHISGALDICWY